MVPLPGRERDDVPLRAHEHRPVVVAHGHPVRIHVAHGALLHVRPVGRVEHGQLHALAPARAVVRVVTDAEQPVLAERVQVFREAGDLQLPEDARVRRVGEIDREQRIHLPERHEIANVAVKAHGLHMLILRDVLDLSEHVEPAVERVERVVVPVLVFIGVDAVGIDALLPSVHGRDDAEHAVVFVHGKLVEQASRERRRARLADLPVADRKEHEVRFVLPARHAHVPAVLPPADLALLVPVLGRSDEQMLFIGVYRARAAEHRLDRGVGFGLRRIDGADNRVYRLGAAGVHADIPGGQGRGLRPVVDDRAERGRVVPQDAAPHMLGGHEIDRAVDHARGDVAAALAEPRNLLRTGAVAHVVEHRIGRLLRAAAAVPCQVFGREEQHHPVAREEHLDRRAPVSGRFRLGIHRAREQPGIPARRLGDEQLAAREIVDIGSVRLDDVRLVHAGHLHVRVGVVAAAPRRQLRLFKRGRIAGRGIPALRHRRCFRLLHGDVEPAVPSVAHAVRFAERAHGVHHVVQLAVILRRRQLRDRPRRGRIRCQLLLRQCQRQLPLLDRRRGLRRGIIGAGCAALGVQQHAESAAEHQQRCRRGRGIACPCAGSPLCGAARAIPVRPAVPGCLGLDAPEQRLRRVQALVILPVLFFKHRSIPLSVAPAACRGRGKAAI